MNDSTDHDDHFELHLDIIDDEANIVDTLCAHCSLSRTRIKQAMSDGAMWLEDSHGIRRTRRHGRKLVRGDKIHFYYDKAVLCERPAIAELIADEGGYSVWNKPYGMRSQGSKWGDHCSITRWAELKLEPPRDARLVHRLDRATRGLMLLAHNRKTATALSEGFRTREIEKHYRAMVHGKLDVQTPCTIDTEIDGKAAQSIVLSTHYDEATDVSQVLLQILTGRKHQVRRHLQSLGHSVVGDRLYGSDDQQDLQLMACYLRFVCPISGEVREYHLD